jgi:NaMN:DMB phosphoribosyltransferase
MLCAALLGGGAARWAAAAPASTTTGWRANSRRSPAPCSPRGRAGHVSAESGHRDLLRELKLEPLLDLNMRLGEASGAGVAILLVRAALACHSGMATFTEAGVSGAED